jgi:hypothetical protein
MEMCLKGGVSLSTKTHPDNKMNIHFIATPAQAGILEIS